MGLLDDADDGLLKLSQIEQDLKDLERESKKSDLDTIKRNTTSYQFYHTPLPCSALVKHAHMYAI